MCIMSANCFIGLKSLSICLGSIKSARVVDDEFPSTIWNIAIIPPSKRVRMISSPFSFSLLMISYASALHLKASVSLLLLLPDKLALRLVPETVQNARSIYEQGCTSLSKNSCTMNRGSKWTASSSSGHSDFASMLNASHLCATAIHALLIIK
ncbi:hypothetical protein SCHPADRAFT_400634 [Schizopora paradoxa]|uniref:Uncharacterized protein n=1 Tax=Schizopora paradoxa TaxID=27342 RepID=A0A0H2RME3_9AGAM|nr:hypothetical protein SCHPADRAFT_400634 [Schizopora paradoxa]